MPQIKLKDRYKLPAFTLVELLVVLAILGTLMSLSSAGIQYALSKSRDVQRANTLKNLENALVAYNGDKNRYPAGEDYTLSDVDSDPQANPVSLLYNDLAEYLVGATNYDPIKSIDDTEEIGYYVYNYGADYALCVVQEARYSNVGLIIGDSGTIFSGCYCKGTMGSHAACTGLTGLGSSVLPTSTPTMITGTPTTGTPTTGTPTAGETETPTTGTPTISID